MTKRIRICQGGTSASKTFSIIFYLARLARLDDKPTLTSIVSESFPHLKRGAMRDFLIIMKELGIFENNRWNKTDSFYTFETGSKIEFFSVDQADKVRGARRERLFINEANNVSFDAFEQLEVRTKEFIFIDYNPVAEFWAFTELNNRNDVERIILTYKDNEALNQNIIDSIEQRKNRMGWWKVYGLGELGEIEGRIYTGWQIIDKIPHEARLERYGLDFGYCVDNKTEILTKDGWKTYNHLTIKDIVLTLNSETGLSEWQKVEKVNVFKGRYEMWSMEKLGHSSFTTNNHKWLIENHNKYSFKETEKLIMGDNIPAARECSTLPKKEIYTDSFIELMAWFWTEGQITDGGISIWQNEGKNAERIRGCLIKEFGEQILKSRNGRNRAFAGWTERPKRNKLCHFAINLNGANRFLEIAPNKIIKSKFIVNLTLKQLKLFLDISVRADGYITKNGTGIITQNSIERLYPIQIACALMGIRTTLKSFINKNKLNYGKELFRLTLFKARKNVYIGESEKGRFIFEGIIWCPTVKNGTWFARRNGTTYFTGNTNDPTAIMAIYYYNGGWILDEKVYKRGMMNPDIANTLKTMPEKLVVADSAEPKSIDEIRAYGINIIPAKKGKDVKRFGIQLIQDQPISVTKQSINAIKEYRNYLWMSDRNGKLISPNEPEDGNDHCLDAVRYAFETLGRLKQEQTYWDRIWEEELTGQPVKKQFNKEI